ncbi:hypothetical protein HPB48_019858 [Haemaphysalis longicornis]|uniref:Uncharacterized protein n=1 Tax=Haemaphysalis longicornis TaxID=44386 RepID=A0A9J6H1M5_HAELO|nr:hypothetical protein HPB48_019858 [Haemaphysalis longicornis]
MHPEHNRERRLARAKTLIDLHARDNGAVYVDAAHLQHNMYVAATMHASTGVLQSAAGVRVSTIAQAEEVAITLVITDPHPCPVYVCPEVYATDIFRLCQEARATLVHLLWNCQPPTSTTTTFPPQLEAAMRSEDYETQVRATTLLNNALDQQRPARRPRGDYP